MSDKNEYPLDYVSLRRALKAWDNRAKLGRHPLSKMEFVQERHHKTGRQEIDVAYGKTLHEVLLEALSIMRSEEENQEPGERTFSPYKLLRTEYQESKGPELTADELGTGIRNYQKWRTEALDKLATIIYEWESGLRDAPRFTHIPFQAPPKPPYDIVGRGDLAQTIKQNYLIKKVPNVIAFYGLPGVGKTALAIEIAHDPDVLEYFNDGVLWAGLGVKPDLLHTLGIWAMTLGLSMDVLATLVTIEERAATVHRAIGTRKMLLVIDDVWSLRDALTFQLGGPNCARIFTTRMPDVAKDLAEQNALVTPTLSPKAGLALLMELAPGIDLGIAKSLADSVDGLPLALINIGNTARKEALKGQSQLLILADRLRSTKELFQLKTPQAPASSHPSIPLATPLSLQVSIGISYETLSESARRVFSDLSVFPPKPSSFSSEAAMAVCNSSVDVIHESVEQGLIQRISTDRYTFHHTISDYMKQKSSGEGAVSRMISYYFDFVKNNATKYYDLDEEISNILAALDIASVHEQQQKLLQGVLYLYPYLHNMGLIAQAETLLIQAEQIARGSVDSSDLLITLNRLGDVSIMQGQYSRADKYFQESLELAQMSGESSLICQSWIGLGLIAAQRKDYDRAELHFQDALELLRELDIDYDIAYLLQKIGGIAVSRSEINEAESYFQEALTIGRELGDRLIICIILGNLGVVEKIRGNYLQAEKYQLKSIDLARSLGHRGGICAALVNLGSLAFRRSDLDLAKEYFLESIDFLSITSINQVYAFSAMRTLGEIAVLQKQYEQAQYWFGECLALARKRGDKYEVSLYLSIVASVVRELEEFGSAEKLFEEALTIARSLEADHLIYASLLGRGSTYLRTSDLDLAESSFNEALNIARDQGSKQLRAFALFSMAQVSFSQGDINLAEQQSKDSLALFEILEHEQTEIVEQWRANHLTSDNTQ